jgi:erythromycin esterase
MVVANAEKYYRAMNRPGPESWNVRDAHMMETLMNLLEYHRSDAKAIVLEHDTHIGDARATNMADHGFLNIGQLVREKMDAGESYAIGFGSYEGSVVAGGSWGRRMKIIDVPKAKENSWEYKLHEAGLKDNILLSNHMVKHDDFNNYFDHRAIGVVYDPTREKYRNYVSTIIPKRYDAFIYLDRTNALHPLQLKPETKEIPEINPWGL